MKFNYQFKMQINIMNFWFFLFVNTILCERSFRIVGNEFQMDGKHFQFLSGSYHYFRQNQNHWEEVMKKMLHGGCNTLHTFIPWNLHEPVKGKFNFKRGADVDQFLYFAQRNGLYAIVQPGPYIGADLDFGGLPYWLLKEENITVRSSDALFMKHVTEYFTKLFNILKPHMYHNGGNVIMVQIENEFGSYAPQSGDTKYLEHLCNLAHQILGNETVLYTTDGPSLYYLQRGSIREHAYATVNFGTGDPTYNFELERSWNNGTGPYVNSEFYTGWVDRWGEKHNKVSFDAVCSSLDRMLSMGASVNMYMYVGGSNLAFTNGATGGGKSSQYKPYVTSYDYDAPISEAGDMTWKYEKIRDVAVKYFDVPFYSLNNRTKKSYGDVYLHGQLTLYNALDKIGNRVKEAEYPMSMEDLDVDYGYVLYQTNVTDGEYLEIPQCRDMCYVLKNQRLMCVIKNGEEKKCYVTNQAGQLDILVENLGRTSYGSDFFMKKGITQKVLLDGKELKNWKMTGFNLTDIDKLYGKFNDRNIVDMPTLYEGSFFIDKGEDIHDTFLYVNSAKHGVVFVKNVNVGRYWNIGPQASIYIPKDFLSTGQNLIYIFDYMNDNYDWKFRVFLDEKPKIDTI